MVRVGSSAQPVRKTRKDKGKKKAGQGGLIGAFGLKAPSFGSFKY